MIGLLGLTAFLMSIGKLFPGTDLYSLDQAWSNEYKSVPGKSFPILIRNAVRPNKPIIGIAMLRSASLSDEAREDAIGWTNEATIRKKIYSKEIEVDFVVNAMIDCLNEQIDNIRTDDFQYLNLKLLNTLLTNLKKIMVLIYDQINLLFNV